MITVLAGVLAFSVGILFDATSLKRVGWLKGLTWLIVSLLMAYAHLSLALSPDKIPLAPWVRWLGWPLLGLGAFMLFYSLYWEIPFLEAYASDRSDGELVQEGTYALVRHPGAIWYAVVLVGLFMVSWSKLALLAAPIWFAMEVLWVWIEDRFIFERIFAGYAEYRATTPMLIPTRESLRRFWGTLTLRKIIMRVFTTGFAERAGRD